MRPPAQGDKKKPLTRRDLADLQTKLSKMSVTALEDFYRSVHYRCRLGDDGLPPAHFIQELVQAWKTMRKGGY